MSSDMDNKIIGDLNKIAKITSEQIFNVTCINCCKLYLEPTTAICGHTLCNSCWRFMRTCPSCGSIVEKKALKLNLVLQERTEHVIMLRDAFEDLFQIKLDEVPLDEPEDQHVSKWLASSQNQFSAQLSTSHDFTPESTKLVKKITSEVQIHTTKNKIHVAEKEIVHKNYQQIDWDKIEEMPDTEANEVNDNLVGDMDIDTVNCMDTKEYTSNNLRRSSRKKDSKVQSATKAEYDIATDTRIEKKLYSNLEKKDNKVVQNWSNVKKMKRDLRDSKSKNTNKLNVSFEECKKTLISTKNPHINDNTVAITDNSKLVSSTKLNLENDDNINKEINKNRDMVISTGATVSRSNSNELENNTTVLAFNSIRQNNNSDLQNNDENYHINKNIQYPKVDFFKRGPLNNKIMDNNTIHMDTNNFKNINRTNTDNIEISIRIGNTLTNICIKKKDNDVRINVNSDQAIQASLCKSSLNVDPKMSVACPLKEPSIQHIEIDNNFENVTNIVPVSSDSPAIQIIKSKSTNKNTASADTSIIHFEITESVEKGLVDNLENVRNNQGQTTSKNVDVATVEELLNDADLFDGESVKEGNIALLKSARSTPSEILMPTCKSITKTQSNTYKRARDNCDMKDFSNFKRAKISQKNIQEDISDVNSKENVIQDDSKPINYESLMSQVFANIDDDIKKLPKKAKHYPISNIQSTNFKNNKCPNATMHPIIMSQKDHINQKCSENIFSLQEKEDLNSESVEEIEHLKEIARHQKAPGLDVDMELTTPVQDDDDKSVVEETPQKSESFSRNKSKVEVAKLTDSGQKLTKATKTINDEIQKENITDTENIMCTSSHSVHETIKNTENMTVVEGAMPISSSETDTPLAKFVDNVKYKSTPMARKSLNFQLKNIINDPDETLCPSSLIAIKTTQEKEFMSKAFEQNLSSPIQTLLVEKNHWKTTKLSIACSCLTFSEKANLKRLCFQRNWSFIDKYTKDLTHLVVGVDEENKSQRSVKYTCALAGGKWIVSYQWVEKCLQVKGVVDPEPFEALDFTGEPGPRRSRISKKKLFHGITFYCMPPFKILDVPTLKDILEMSGGRVVDDVSGVRVTDTPALLLAEPENTQEDRFIYLAMELSVVPVNFEWMVNCLGSYNLSPINELLLCPELLLPRATSNWPLDLLSR